MEIDLRRLAGLGAPDRAFLTVYRGQGEDIAWFDREIARVRRHLERGGDEEENLIESARMARAELLGVPPSRSSAIFACWLLDFIERHEIAAPLRSRVILDSSPYLRPLAEALDEYETFAIVYLDHSEAHIRLVTVGAARDLARIKGEIKNHVKHGGWSQQRYERRRRHQIHHYLEEIAAVLRRIAEDEPFDRLILAGDHLLTRGLREHLPEALRRRVIGEKALQADLSDRDLLRELLPIFFEAERAGERRLYDRIRAEFLRGGRGVFGPAGVLEALEQGRVARLLLDRNARGEAVRCRACNALSIARPPACPRCGGEPLAVELFEELAELAYATGAEVEFADPIPGLLEEGGAGALLRY